MTMIKVFIDTMMIALGITVFAVSGIIVYMALLSEFYLIALIFAFVCYISLSIAIVFYKG